MFWTTIPSAPASTALVFQNICGHHVGEGCIRITKNLSQKEQTWLYMAMVTVVSAPLQCCWQECMRGPSLLLLYYLPQEIPSSGRPLAWSMSDFATIFFSSVFMLQLISSFTFVVLFVLEVFSPLGLIIFKHCCKSTWWASTERKKLTSKSFCCQSSICDLICIMWFNKYLFSLIFTAS